jgi:hypothetical protein
MRKIITRLAAGTVLLLVALMPLGPVSGQPFLLPLECKDLAFSTEEDFVSGETIISDGDLLSVTAAGGCLVCARNADLLLETFDVSYDLGLDAVDVIGAGDATLVAFSTELDSPNNVPGSIQFTAGDLLVTNGVVIPNRALTYPFGVPYDIGLDAVHFVSEPPGNVRLFLEAATQYSREDWLQDPELLPNLLSEYVVGIWYSTEGTWTPPGGLGFLDGDLLSVQTPIIAPHADLLPPSVPAGIPDRGVDFGLDAATADRWGNWTIVHFSTELLFDGQVSFTDGDVLLATDGIVHTNPDLLKCFEPKAEFLGLDALHKDLLPAEIQGKKFHDLNANGALDVDEPGLERWEIHLDGTDAIGNPVKLETTTGAEGAYNFVVPPGSYEVSEVCPDETWYQSRPAPIDGCGTGVHSLNLTEGQVIEDVDFGNYQHAVKSGYKFNDLSGEGRWDVEEPPLVGWEIRLDGTDGLNNPVNQTTLTNDNGYYIFTVPPGSYEVSEVCPDGTWIQSLPAPTNGCGSGIYQFDPISGDPPHTENNFGNYQPGADYPIYLPIVLKNYP